jgi:hypothetical protein
MTTIKFFGGDLGNETMMVRCNLSQASSPVQVDYMEGGGWTHTQYQCADARHSTKGLVNIGKELAAHAIQMPEENFDCEWQEVD